MKKYIMILDAVRLLAMVLAGKRIQGVLYLDADTGRLTFKPYYTRGLHKRDDRLIRNLEHGWVKESMERIKMYLSLPKCLGTARMMGVMDRESKEAKDALVDRELLNFI